jgi:endogenous inhibitor of DNA gyrase (YacG/DUF329 family)
MTQKRICPGCQRIVDPRRSLNAKFCSSRCQEAYHHRMKKAKRPITRAHKDVISGEQMTIDWADYEQVKALAIKIGAGQTVYKHIQRSNYNICHTENETKLVTKDCIVVFRT